MLDHIKRLQVKCVPFSEYKGALEGFSAIGMLAYDEVLPMLDKYKDYVLSRSKNILNSQYGYMMTDKLNNEGE